MDQVHHSPSQAAGIAFYTSQQYREAYGFAIVEEISWKYQQDNRYRNKYDQLNNQPGVLRALGHTCYHQQVKGHR